MKKAFFVTGTDTGVGKTSVSCLLLRAYAAQGLKTVGLKPVASGCQRIRERLVSDDALQLQAAGNVAASLELINPYAFEPPLAPHIAAGQAGVTIRAEPIMAAFDTLRNLADVVMVEGVGGFRVPLNDRLDTADLAQLMALPVILVVGMRLGCINHALLTAEAIRSRGLHLAGWVANRIDPGMEACVENMISLKNLLLSPLIAEIAYQKDTEIRGKSELPDILLP